MLAKQLRPSCLPHPEQPAPFWLLLEIDVGERLPIGVAQPGRRKWSVLPIPLCAALGERLGSSPLAASHCSGNLPGNNIDDLLGILPIEMRVLDRYPSNEFRSDHPSSFGGRRGSPGRSSLFLTSPEQPYFT